MRIFRLFLVFVFCGLWSMQLSALVSSMPKAISAQSTSAQAVPHYPPDIAAIKKRGEIRVGMFAAGAPPFFMQDAAGNWSGINIDFSQMMAAALGVKLVIVPISDYDTMINTVSAGKVDLAEGLISITPARALLVRFSNPTYGYHPSLLVNRLQLARLGWTIPKLTEELANATQPIKIGAMQSAANIALLTGAIPNVELVTFPTESQALEAASEGKVFASMADTSENINDWLNDHPNAALTTTQGVLKSRTILFGVALPWASDGLRDWLNVFIRDMKIQGTQAQIFAKYGMENPGL
jgi:polar amino acid transport system substrate-binding protein